MQLIDNWRMIWWRRWSTWIAGLNALFVTYVFSQPVLVVGLLGFSPDGWAVPLAIFLGLMAFGLPVLVAHTAQPKLEAKIEAKQNADAAAE